MSDSESPWSLALWRVYNAAILLYVWVSDVSNLHPFQLNRAFSYGNQDYIIIEGLILLALGISVDRDGCRMSRKKRSKAEPGVHAS
jgi:hypothetical protein